MLTSQNQILSIYKHNQNRQDPYQEGGTSRPRRKQALLTLHLHREKRVHFPFPK